MNEELITLCQNKIKIQELLCDCYIFCNGNIGLYESHFLYEDIKDKMSLLDEIYAPNYLFESDLLNKLKESVDRLEKNTKLHDKLLHEICWKRRMKTLKLIREFLNKINCTKHVLESSYSPEVLRLKLLRDPRLPPLDFVIPEEIETAKVLVEYIDIVVPKPQIFEIPINAFGDKTKKCGWLDLRMNSKLCGLKKTLNITTGFKTYTTKFDGTCLKIHSSQAYMPYGMECAIATLSTISIPVWTRKIIVICEYTDPLV
jgi:hypothetical protein